MNKTRINTKNILIITIVVLVLINLASLSALWVNKQEQSITDELIAKQPDMKRFFRDELHFSAQQVTQMEQIKKEHIQQIRASRNQIKSIRKQLYDENFSENRSDEQINMLLDQLIIALRDREQMHINHMQDMREIATPEQYENLKLLFFDLAERHHGKPYRHQRRHRNQN